MGGGRNRSPPKIADSILTRFQGDSTLLITPEQEKSIREWTKVRTAAVSLTGQKASGNFGCAICKEMKPIRGSKRMSGDGREGNTYSKCCSDCAKALGIDSYKKKCDASDGTKRRDGPRRVFVKKMRAIGQAVQGQAIAPLIAEIQRRMRWMCRNGGGNGAYIFGDSEGYVYLLRADSGVTDRMVSELPRMVVGMYVTVTAEQLAEDLTAHFVSVGYITEQIIRNAVCEVEG